MTNNAVNKKQHYRAAEQWVVSIAVLNQAVQVLGLVLAFTQPADAVLSGFFKANRNIGQHDRAWIAETVYRILRRLRFVRDWAGEEVSPRQLLLTWLLKGEGWSLRRFDALITSDDKHWLSVLQQRHLPNEKTLGQQTDMPDWLVDTLLQQYDEATLLMMARALNHGAPMDLRVNTMKTDRKSLLEALGSEDIDAEAGIFAPQSIRLKEKQALQRYNRFLQGEFEVQDEGSQLVTLLMQPRRGETVVDFCAGAGGKTLQLAAIMRSTGQIYAFDISERRLARLKPRLIRSGVSNIHPVKIIHENDQRVKRLSGKVDRVLVDAPCSGLGTLRRNPDLKWRQTPEAVAELTRKQLSILLAASELVKPGGRLVYATCSLLAAENENIIHAFMAQKSAEFQSGNACEILSAQKIDVGTGEFLHLYPHVHHTDGFFAAVLERVHG